jgi:hypothetical protein
MAVAERLYPYIGGIVRAERGVLYEFDDTYAFD